MTYANIGEEAFEEAYAALPEARCKIRRKRDVIEKALSVGIRAVKTETEQGLYNGIDANVRIINTTDLKPALTEGDVIEVLPYGGSDWIKCRINGRAEHAGIIRLSLESAYNE